MGISCQYEAIKMARIYSNQWTVSVSSGGGGGGGGGGALPAKFNVSPQLTVNMPVAMISYWPMGAPYPCYYVSDYISSSPCCGAKPSGYAFTLSGQIQDSVGKPVPNTPYEIYLMTPDPNLRVIDYVTASSKINPTQSDPLMAMSDPSGYMNLGFVYYGYPAPDPNINNYPKPLIGSCTEGNTIPSLAVSDTIQFNIPNTAITANTIIAITWQKHYISIGALGLICPSQNNQCLPLSTPMPL
jgi:hypothetical protein